MFDFDGYAFVNGWNLDNYSDEAVAVVKDRITKEQLIEWGWYIRINPNKVSISRLREGSEFEYVKDGVYSYYSLYSAEVGRNCPYFKTYWLSSGVTDSSIVNFIDLMRSAPLVDDVKEVCDAYFTTEDGQQLTTNIWTFPLNRLPITFVPKNTPIPGLDFQYGVKKKGFRIEPSGFPEGYFRKYGAGVDSLWDGNGYGGASDAIRNYLGPYRSFAVLFNNCEVAPLCVRFTYVITTDTRNPTRSDPVGHFTSASIHPSSIGIPTKVRRLAMARFQPRTKTETISCHIMTWPMVKSLINDLYTTDVYEKIKHMLYGDGANNLLSLKWFYGVRSSVSATRQSKVTLGNVVLDGVITPVHNGDFVQVYMGYVNVPREYNDYRDYTNVQYHAYIPMVGDIDLDPSQVVGKDLHLLYTVNLTDGSAIVTLAVSNLMTGGEPVLPQTDGWYDTPQIVFTSSITYGYEIPLKAESIQDPSLRVGEVVAKAVIAGIGGAVAGGIPGAAIGAAGGAGAGVVRGAGVQNTYSVGSLTPNSNILGDFTPKLYRTITKDVSGDISAAVGLPCGKVVKVGDVSGYLKAAMVYGTPSTTMQHTDEIINMLKEGIYIS